MSSNIQYLNAADSSLLWKQGLYCQGVRDDYIVRYL
jgi:hypothetical protein